VATVKPFILVLILCGQCYLAVGQDSSLVKNKNDTIRTKFDSLKAVIVTAVRRPHMIGDTVEYNVEHLEMQPNTVVEELLRQLPGLQVDINGNITYNGESIEHLLVDGQDLFGSTPTLVTRNFDASKIALVQIVDRKSDNALFTGIDGGNRTKTLNLVLREDARNGYFGKLEAGGDWDQYYDASGMIVAFREKKQFAAIGMTANTGILSASGDGAKIGFLYGISDPLGASAGAGIPSFSAAALHYANTWDRIGDRLDFNYQFSHYFTKPITLVEEIQSLPDSTYGQEQQSRSINSRDQHWVDAKFEWTPTVHSSFRFTFRGSNSQEHNQFASTGTSTFNDTLVNRTQRNIQDTMGRQYTTLGIAWRTQIGRQAGSIFSVTSGLTAIDVTTNGYLYSLIKFYESNGNLQSIDTVDERKRIITRTFDPSGTVNYTQPMWNGTLLCFSYGLTVNSDKPFQGTYNRGDGQYVEMVDSLSSHLDNRTINQHVTFNLQGTVKHLNYTLGNDWVKYNYRQDDLIADSAVQVHYFNQAPRLLVSYTPNQRFYIGFQYNAITQEPTISQLAPIENNNDPLHITLGNPNLKPGINQNLKLDFHWFGRWLFNMNLSMALIENSISTKTTTDSLGRQISEPVNVGGGRTDVINISLNRRLEGFDIGFHASGNYSRMMSYLNTDLSQNNTYTSGVGFSLNKYVANRYSVQINTNLGYFCQFSSINLSNPVRYWTQSHSGALTVWFIPKFEIGMNATYTWQEKTIGFAANTSVLIWNSYVSRDFACHKLTIKAGFKNLLNENAGISRTNAANINTETTTNILGRYWMLSAAYHFDKKFKKK
jgi:hypothetical protein